MIQVWNYLREYDELRDEILEAVDKVFKSGRLILGDEVKRFEHDYAEYSDCRFGVGVNSGTDALLLGLKALGIEDGDEVITVSNTAVPTVSAIVNAGGIPKFVDIDPDTYLMDVGLIEAEITERTKFILPVHLYGQCVDMDPLMDIAERHGLKVLEDCAQCSGATYKGRKAGSLGHAAAFSFYPTKVLGGYGDGGLIVTNDEDAADLARSLRMYGMEAQYYSERHGFNSRLDEVQAAILNVKLKYLDDWIETRTKLASIYDEALPESLQLPIIAPDNKHAYYVYVVAHDDRDDLMAALKEDDIFVNISYPWPISIMRGYADLGYKEGDLPATERAAKRIFSLPMFPTLQATEVNQVIDSLAKALR